MDKTVKLVLDFKFDPSRDTAYIDNFMKSICNKITDIAENENVEVNSNSHSRKL